MATFTITLPENTSICDGKQITFKAPADSTNVTGIIIDGTTYSLVDSSNANVSEGVFKKDAMVSVVLDTTNTRAFVLNGGGCAVQFVTWEAGDK